jgi:hypothetical protein
MNDEPDVPDFVDAIVCLLEGHGFELTTAERMVIDIMRECWRDVLIYRALSHPMPSLAVH